MAKIRRKFLFLVLLFHHVMLCLSRAWIRNRPFWRRGLTVLDVRGGSEENSENVEEQEVDTGAKLSPDDHHATAVDVTPPSYRRHSSDVIRKILDPQSSTTLGPQNNNLEESIALRELITSRTEDYIAELEEAIHNHNEKLPHPRKLLHYLAPKVPSIKQSPDVNLRIHSSKADIDPGVAACIIGNLACVCEMYDKEVMLRAGNTKPSGENESGEKHQSVTSQITTDRRFEQLVECVISGINVQKRKSEFVQRQMDNTTDEAADMEEVLDQEHARVDEGLNIRDMCRAAWGISILGAHHLKTLGGVDVHDLLLGLSLRMRELLLARLQLLRQDDILNRNEDSAFKITTDERLSEISEELAIDAAIAMWTFACVRVCTGVRSPHLFEAACSLLCQDPVDLRRRAQESNQYEEGNPSIGNSDVIDRLALSETSVDDANVTSVDEESPVRTEKDVLLSWLSPTEVLDVLLALTLHGSNETSALDNEVTLSETASTLREISFDRMVEWLEIDLASKAALKDPQALDGITEAMEFENDDELAIEVVDAAALLASQEHSEMPEACAISEDIPVENLTVNAGGVLVESGSGQEVEVVDAAKLLASATSREEIDVQTEVIVAPASVMKSTTIVSSLENEVLQTSQEVMASEDDDPIFTPHDLASVAWLVTELSDPLKTTIVGTIIELFANLGFDGLYLSGGDLANLVWSFAKYEGDGGPTTRLRIAGWIAEHAFRKVEEGGALKVFHPPELGRFMWSLAWILSTQTDNTDTDIVGPNYFVLGMARNALLSTAENLSLFSTEDLTRISWAFLELIGDDLSALGPSEISALGKLLATIDMSLYRWERGQCGTEFASQGSQSDVSLFSSFFGRPRLHFPLLDLILGGEEEEDDDDALLAALSKKGGRPRLKDLSIDPATLCKASCNFQRLSSSHPHIKCGWTLTRVTVRLLASKKGRLLKEISTQDLVRLCEAAVLSEVDGHGRELIIGLFARQVVSLLNDVLSVTNDASSVIVLDELTSSEAATMIWVLGELGVKVSSLEDNGQSNRKMKIDSLDPLVKLVNVETLDSTRLHRLIRGLVMMKEDLTQHSLLLGALKKVKDNLSGSVPAKYLCMFAEDAGMVTESLAGRDKIKPTETESAKDDENQQVIETADDNDGDENDLLAFTDELLDSIANAASEISKSLTSTEIRRLLEVYSLLPHHADEMIQTFDDEVSQRLMTLEKLSKNQTLGTLLKFADGKALVVKETLYAESDKSFFGSMKNAFTSLFGSNSKAQEEDKAEEPKDALTEQIASMIQESIMATSAATDNVEALESSLRVSIDEALASLCEEASFELGRATELLENYRRIDFSSGKRTSRYDMDRRETIAKQVLNRLIP